MKPKPYVIDVVDCSDQAGINTCDNLIGHNTVTVRMGGMSNATLKMIDLVINAAEGQYGAIRCLAFWGHGSVDANHKGLGLQYVAGTSESVETRNALGARTIQLLATQLAQLQPFFAPDARVELRGCGVADGDGSGVEIMRRLAHLWQVRVQGNSKDNMATYWGMSPSNNARITEVSPGGSVRLVQGIGVNDRT